MGIVAGALGAGSALLGYNSSKKQAKAAQNAADTQAEATKYASDLQQKQYEQTRSDLMPYSDAGKNALGQLTGFNPQAYQGDQFSFNGSGDTGYSSQLPDSNIHSAYDGPTYQVGEFNFEESPSYQFRKQQGMDGIQGSAAARGGLQSGGTLKALNNYNSDLASQEYATAHNQYLQNEGLNQNQAQLGFNQYLGQAGLQQNNFNNALQNEQMRSNQHQQAFNNYQSQDNNAYSRYMTDQNNQYSRLNNLVGIGQNASAGIGNMGAQTAQSVANNTMAGANAQASGIIGAANARADGMQNLIGGMGSLAGLFI